MLRCSKLFSSLLAAFVMFSFTACASHEEAEPTPEQQMQKMIAQPGVKILKSGLAYKVLASGPKDGEQPRPGDMMMVIYQGKLPDGSIFDSSEQHGDGAYMQMPLQGLVDGWMEALPMMHVGDTWMLYVPAKLGYGHKAMGVIPEDSPLIFRIQLLGVDHAH